MDDILFGPENGEMSSEEGAVALPNFGANEANGNSQNGAAETKPPKSWELPLRIPEIRKSSNTWSLASDAGLLLFLQEFSQKMIAKTSDLEKQVDGLVNEAKSTDSRVHNVFNDFLMLANTQFIENRVYDDADDLDAEKDLSQSSSRNESKSREQREAEVIPRVTKALSLGINVLDTAFEQLDPHIGDSDSEEEEATYKAVDPILEPKDLYAHRALPYIIGTPAFMQDDDVGLAFSEEEDELTEDEEEEDEGESDLSDESEFSETELETSDMEESDTTGTPRSKKGTETKSDSEESDDGDLFGPEKSEDEDEDVAKPKAPGYADELAAKLGAAAAAGVAEEGERPRTISETSSKGKKRKKAEKERTRKKRGESKTEEDNLFESPAEVEDEDSPFSKKGLFSPSSGGLFDDEEKEEGGLFDEKPPGEEEESSEHPPDHIYEDIKGIHGHSSVHKTTRSGKKVPAGGVALFGAEGSDDLFGSSPTSKEAGEDARLKKTARQTKTAGGLFDEDDDLFAENTSKPAKKGPKDVDLFGNEGEDDLFGEKPAETKKEPTKKKLPAGAVSLFGDAPNPLAGKLSPTKTPSDEEQEQKKTPPVAKKPAKSSGGGLFAEGGDGDLFTASSKPSEGKKSSKGSLFDEEVDDTDIFATPPEPKGNRPKADSSLFDDLEDEGAAEDMFAKPKEYSKKKPPGGVALFGNADMFGSPPRKASETPPVMKKALGIRDRRTNTLSLFNDDDEKDESQEVKAAAVKEEKQIRRRAKSKSVFDDEEVLFGSKNEEDPAVDLFGSGSPVSPEKPQSPEDLVYENPDDLMDDDGLFDDDEEDNLFGEARLPPGAIMRKPKEKKKDERRSGGLFGEDADDDLFGDGGKKKDAVHYAESTKKSHTTPDDTDGQRKKPIGGVAMFGGGIDPLNTTAAKANTNNSRAKKPSTPSTPKDVASSPDTKPAGFKSVSPPAGNKVSALQANMAINPAALKPGAAPPSREVEPEPIDFTKPAEVKTLDSDFAKNRARVSVKRRPPSRAGRQTAARLSQNPALYSDSISSVPEEAYQDLPSPSQIPRMEATKPKPKPSSDLFSNDDDLFSDKSLSSKLSSIPSKSDSKRTPPSGDKDVSKASPFSDSDDLFGPSLPVKKIEPVVVKKKETKKSLPDLDDDLFADSSVLPKKKAEPKVNLGVDEDLFGDTSSSKKATPKPSVDEDDLFAVSAPVAASAAKKESKKKPVVEDDDDLFGEKKSTPKKTKSKASKTADKDIFSDTTDIFTDVPSKPKEKKKKKQDQGLFGDVPGDDIFASPSSSSSKPKKTKTKKKEKKPSSGEDIFSTDAPNIFDDPLSALKN